MQVHEFQFTNGARMRASLEVRERRRAENDARAARIMTAAARVFARRGVENATMEMIAREANVAVGTIYLHFASRDEVYLNLCAERGMQLGAGYREVLARGLAAPPGDLPPARGCIFFFFQKAAPHP